MYEIFRVLRALRSRRDTETQQPVPGSRSRSWGVSTWVMATGILVGVVGLMGDRRLLLPGSVLFIAGLVAALVGSVIEALRDR